MSIIIGLVGEMAAGKTTITEHLKAQYGATTFRFSTMLRDVASRMHLEQNRSNLQTLSTTIRQAFGDDIMSKVIAKDVAEAAGEVIVVEGIRRPSDATYLKELPNFHIISINVDERTRYERITERSENPDDQTKTWEEFQAEGQQESEQKVKEIAATADFQVNNDGNLDATLAQVDDIVTSLQS